MIRSKVHIGFEDDGTTFVTNDKNIAYDNIMVIENVIPSPEPVGKKKTKWFIILTRNAGITIIEVKYSDFL